MSDIVSGSEAAPAADGGNAPEVETTAAPEAAVNEASAPDWRDGLSEERRALVGDRSLDDYIDWSDGQFKAASRRAEEVMKAEGLSKRIAPDAEAGEYFNDYRPDTVSKYAERVGMEEGEISAQEAMRMEAAHHAGLHVDQYKVFRGQQQVLQEAADKKSAEEAHEALKEHWGADFEPFSQLASRRMESLGWDEGKINTVSKLIGTSKDYVGLMDQFAKEGELLSEPANSKIAESLGGAGGGAGTVHERRAALNEKVGNQGGIATPEQERMYEKLYDEEFGPEKY